MTQSKKNNFRSVAIIGLAALALMSCHNNDNTSQTSSSTRTLDTTLGIEAVPGSLGKDYMANFDGYTKVSSPNGGTIHIVAQSRITNEQIVRARSVLEHYLKNLPGSVYGADKSAVANQMAANGAILILLNGRDDGRNPVQVHGQPLFEEEIQVEGHSWYMNQDFEEHRDATFEEILHLVHDYGIGVDGPNSNPGALPAFQAEIRAAQKNALSNKIWAVDPRAADWVAELAEENSLSQEYLAALIDVYYGLWGADVESPNTGMHGLYAAKVRADIAKEDLVGASLLQNKFFHTYLTYNARIDASLNGNFSLKFDASKPYTHHAQYLKDITLLGTHDNTVTVNQMDNDITGNAGVNTVIFSGKSSEYEISTENGTTKVTDKMPDRDGTNTLTAVEKLQFTDKTVEL